MTPLLCFWFFLRRRANIIFVLCVASCAIFEKKNAKKKNAMGKKKNVQRSLVFQKQSSTAVGTPGGQAAGSKKHNCDDATSGSDATRLLFLQKVALVQKSDNFFLFPAATYKNAK